MSTLAIYRHEGDLLRQNKEVSLDLFRNQITRAMIGDTILVTGTYDLPHTYHFRYIRTCKYLIPGLSLVLAIDSDEYVRQRKGPSRPIMPYEVRRDTLSELDFVDYVVEHDGDNEKLIRTVAPKIFAMSYSTSQEAPEGRVVDIEAVMAAGGYVVALPVLDEYEIGSRSVNLSTSGLVQTVLEKSR
jgi:cytidyltransferase-like protein